MNRLTLKLNQLSSKGEKAFVPYIMAGDGGIEKLGETIKLLESFGSSAVEIGIPFSDPVADGPVIQKAGIRALKKGTSLKETLVQIGQARHQISIPIIIMTYVNPILAYGIEKFSHDCSAAGVDGCIIPDLPIEEESFIEPYLTEAGIELIRLVTLTTPIERIEDISRKGNGFLYAVTVKGVTGGRTSFHEELKSFLSKVSQVSRIPVLAGFGISTDEQAKELASYCDGVIVGSKIVELLDEGNMEELEKLVSSLQKVAAPN
ncbi:tryptophan synthase subunit alpha [Bacillus sp. FJAT-27225]|uniref:tryptophan synthase subunit alpha n=1 Tax=Bacillus sp. FJAT-27225 TaxID=1743144 RepID=UPI00080C2F83|nr:tryptophan synthase subunit alpha [Bacillus sp. FJAT-27225]OCA90795.1 tryptophan synthase subunit alpha [Bacillus sp. FJAT-27225]